MDTSSQHMTIPFSFFASLLREISNIPRKKKAHKSHSKGPSPSSQSFEVWVNELRRKYPSLAPGTTATVFRLLFPEEDIARKYGMQETTLAHHLSHIFMVSTSPDGRGRGLLDWNAATAIGCLGTEVEEVLRHREQDPDSSVSANEIDGLLTELAASCPYSSSAVRSAVTAPRSKRVVLSKLYQTLSSDEAAFVTQIILKDLRPTLYPLRETHYSASLLQYNTTSVIMLTKEEAMKMWDPSGKMLSAYRVRAVLDAAGDIYEDSNAVIAPQLGIPIAIPKCIKGQGCAHSAKLMRRSHKVWAETKYDGERAQIHVEVDENKQSHITIFSKSKRDSTLDRYGIHRIIREALGLPQRQEGHSRPSEKSNPQRIKNIIIEAEMVAYNDELARIDEFWRIRSLIASTSMGVRHTSVAQTQDNQDSQCSMASNASDRGARHLALVFFDLLVLNDDSILHRPYSERRTLLESLVTVIPGYSMLAARVPIMCSYGLSQVAEDLATVFAALIADHEEGLVLKADESRYNDWKQPWIKLKKDYIPGHGDTVDMVILGAGWDKDRARELCVAPTVFTTFYLGMLRKDDADTADPTDKPSFMCIFCVSYGLSREKLEELNFMIRASDPVKTLESGGQLPYSCSFYSGMPLPAVMLTSPLTAEVFGAGFTKSPGSKYYELRFARISKVFRPSERSWKDAITSEEYQKIARDVVGLDRSGKPEDDWCNMLWGKPASPGVRSAVKRKTREDDWFQKLQQADGRSPTRRRLVLNEDDTQNINSGDSVASKYTKSIGIPSLQAMSSVTNLAAMNPFVSPQPSLAIPVSPNPEPGVAIVIEGRISTTSPSASQAAPPTILRPDTVSVHADEDVSEDAEQTLQIPPPVSNFLEDAAVWFARPTDAKRPIDRMPSRYVVPIGQIFTTLDALFLACSWTENNHIHRPCTWAKKGVIFVDDNEQWLAYPMAHLLGQRSRLLREHETLGLMKPVWVISMRALERKVWENEGDTLNMENYCLCKLG